jgi:hypothetical protein
MWEKEEVIDTLEFLAGDIGGGREVEHVFEADRRFLARAVAFADEAGPHCVVELREGLWVLMAWWDGMWGLV